MVENFDPWTVHKRFREQARTRGPLQAGMQSVLSCWLRTTAAQLTSGTCNVPTLMHPIHIPELFSFALLLMNEMNVERVQHDPRFDDLDVLARVEAVGALEQNTPAVAPPAAVTPETPDTPEAPTADALSRVATGDTLSSPLSPAAVAAATTDDMPPAPPSHGTDDDNDVDVDVDGGGDGNGDGNGNGDSNGDGDGDGDGDGGGFLPSTAPDTRPVDGSDGSRAPGEDTSHASSDRSVETSSDDGSVSLDDRVDFLSDYLEDGLGVPSIPVPYYLAFHCRGGHATPYSIDYSWIGPQQEGSVVQQLLANAGLADTAADSEVSSSPTALSAVPADGSAATTTSTTSRPSGQEVVPAVAVRGPRAVGAVCFGSDGPDKRQSNILSFAPMPDDREHFTASLVVRSLCHSVVIFLCWLFVVFCFVLHGVT